MNFQCLSTIVTSANFLMMKGNFDSYFRLQKISVKSAVYFFLFCCIRGFIDLGKGVGRDRIESMISSTSMCAMSSFATILFFL